MLLHEASEAERVVRDAATAAAWGKGLTPAQFLERERVLRGHAFASSALRAWHWRAGERTLSSCETFEVPARRGAKEGRAFIIASVFTEPEHRGRGHAVALIDALCRRLAVEGALAVALFSEVGTRIYERAGFVAQPGFDVTLPPNKDAPLPKVEWTTQGLGPPVRAPPPADDASVRLALSPSQCDWHLTRARFYASALGRVAPAAHVARVGASSLAITASFQRNELHVLWYDFHADAEAALLLEACQAVAAQLSLPRVRVWETTPFALPSDATRAVRDDELPMLRPLDGGPATWADIAQGLWA